MAPEVTDWITSIAAVGAVIAALYIARKQIAIQNRQADILDKQADFQERQTNISKLQADIARQQTDITKGQTEIARQQLKITENQEQDRRRGKLQSELTAKIDYQKVDERRKASYLQIENKGPSDAREIKLQVEGDIAGHILSMPMELPLIAAGTSLRYLLLLTVGMSNEFILDVSWSDDSGEPRHKRIPLRV